MHVDLRTRRPALWTCSSTRARRGRLTADFSSLRRSGIPTPRSAAAVLTVQDRGVRRPGRRPPQRRRTTVTVDDPPVCLETPRWVRAGPVRWLDPAASRATARW